jgi:hypothetical protein
MKYYDKNKLMDMRITYKDDYDILEMIDTIEGLQENKKYHDTREEYDSEIR